MARLKEKLLYFIFNACWNFAIFNACWNLFQDFSERVLIIRCVLFFISLLFWRVLIIETRVVFIPLQFWMCVDYWNVCCFLLCRNLQRVLIITSTFLFESVEYKSTTLQTFWHIDIHFKQDDKHRKDMQKIRVARPCKWPPEIGSANPDVY